MNRIEQYWNEFVPVLVAAIPKVALAFITLLVGWWLIGWISGMLRKLMEKRGLDPSVQGFLSGLSSVLLKVMLLISVAGMVGIETASFVAVIAAMGLAVGLALQGSLANFAGGVLILIFKPYKVGDVIETQGVIGKVKDIQIFNTIMLTPENRTAIIPNGKLSNDKIINFTQEGTLRTEINVGVSYDAPVDVARERILEILHADDRVLSDPEPAVVLKELGDNAVNLGVRAYTDAGDAWPMYFDNIEKIKMALDKEGIGIPYPQRDVHVFMQPGAQNPAG